ncbi:MAG: C4-dicarboxylate ABC transporter, partial [Deltaproteobacteria bacterium]|nr:C4-dicarboxylate ABC transporter [Deltaproteobacteria bacterium]
WEGLPSSIRNQLEQAMKEATSYENRIAQEENDNALALLKATGKIKIYSPTASERNALKKAMLKTHSEMAPRIGKATIDAIYAEKGFNPAKTSPEIK